MKSAKNSTSTTSTNSASSMPMEMMPSLTSMPLWSLTSKPRSTLILFPHSLLLFLLVFFVFVCLIQLGTQNRKGKKKKKNKQCVRRNHLYVYWLWQNSIQRSINYKTELSSLLFYTQQQHSGGRKNEKTTILEDKLLAQPNCGVQASLSDCTHGEYNKVNCLFFYSINALKIVYLIWSMNVFVIGNWCCWQST